MGILRRAVSALLAVLLILSLPGTALAAPPDNGFGSRQNEEETVRAIVIFEDAPASDAGVRGSAGAAARRAKLEREHTAFTKSLERRAIPFTLNYSYTALLNGVSVTVAYRELDTLRQLDGVREVHIANTYQLPEEQAAAKTAAAGSVTGADLAHTKGFDGKGTVIAVLDTGLNTKHEAFQDYGLTEKVVTRRTLLNTETRGQYLSAKVPFAYDYAGNDDDVTDYQGHGTHVAGIAGGYAQDADGTPLFSGAAPAAQLLIMKIFADGSGSTSSDVYFAALEDAYLLGADVVNMSLGSPDGFSYDYSLETAFGNIYDRLYQEGILVCTAAGNEYSQAAFSRNHRGNSVLASYADYGVVATPSTLGQNVSVASIENAAYPAYAITVDGTSFAYRDSSSGATMHMTFGGRTVPYEIIPGNGADADYAELDVTGKIAVVTRGGTSFSEKLQAAAGRGAIGLLVVNNTSGSFSMGIDRYDIPAASVSQAAGEILKHAESRQLTFSADTVVVENPDSGRMSEFSSWGTTPDLRLKPNITAVGGSVCSASFDSNDGYEVMSGTSMATPDAAGCYALLLQAIRQSEPELSKAEQLLRAEALAESTAQIVMRETAAYSPRKQGAGLFRADRAVSAGAFLTDPLQELGDDPDKTGSYTFTLTVQRPLAECTEHAYRCTETTPATCTETGTAVYVCEKCHATYTETLAALGHDWDDGVLVREPTLSEDGERRYTCKRNAAHTKTERIPHLEACDGGEGCPSRALTDVDRSADSWSHAAIDWAVSAGVTNGVDNSHFAPEAGCTRAQAVTFLWRASGSPEPASESDPFSDTADGSYYGKAVRWAVENGITNGTSRTEFSPDAVCTRAQIVTFLWRLNGSSSGAGGGTFADVPADSYYADAVAWAVAQGITTGVSATAFAPDSTCTRAHIVTFLYRSRSLSHAAAETAQPASDAAELRKAQPQRLSYRITPQLLVDVVEEKDGTLYNTLQQQAAEVDITVMCDGETLTDNILTFESWETEKTVTITLTLRDSTRRYLDDSFENGGFVDGYVLFTPTDGSETLHATLLAFYGDWTQAPILSPFDFRDEMDAMSLIHWERENTDLIHNIYDINEMDLDYNAVYVGAFQAYKVLGSNPYEGLFHSTYDRANCYLSNNQQTCFNTGLYIYPCQLRNARRMILTVTDAQTGELYAHQELEYVGKAYYSGSQYSWQPRGFFSWFGKDMGGAEILDGTKVRVSLYASLDYGTDPLQGIAPKELATKAASCRVWEFDVTMDNTAPVIGDVSYDPATKQLTVKATDDCVMAYLGAEEQAGDDGYAFYLDLAEGNDTGVYTLDLSGLTGDTVTIRAEDMAANRTTLSFTIGS